MIPPDWIEHRRADGEIVGWMVPDGEGFRVRDRLGREVDAEVVGWLTAEERLDARGIGLLAEGWEVVGPDGRVRPVRIAEVTPDRIVAVADEFGAASAVGASPDRFVLPFPAPATLRRRRV